MLFGKQTFCSDCSIDSESPLDHYRHNDLITFKLKVASWTAGEGEGTANGQLKHLQVRTRSTWWVVVLTLA